MTSLKDEGEVDLVDHNKAGLSLTAPPQPSQSTSVMGNPVVFRLWVREIIGRTDALTVTSFVPTTLISSLRTTLESFDRSQG